VIDDLRLSAERRRRHDPELQPGQRLGEHPERPPDRLHGRVERHLRRDDGLPRVLEGLQRYTKVNQVGLSLAADESDDPDLSSNVGFTVYVFTGTDPGER
jgi:hypothetical protein